MVTPACHRCRLGCALAGAGRGPPIEVAIANHVATAVPVVIEGDGINPALLERPEVRERGRDERVAAVFGVEPDEAALVANAVARGRGIAGLSEAELRNEARAKWLHGRWLADEARRRGLPVLEPRPWATLAERIAAAVTSPAEC